MIALLVLVPLCLALEAISGYVVWAAWAVISIAAGLDAVSIANRAFPSHRSPTVAVMISGLALLNVVVAFSVVTIPLFRN